MKPGQDSKSFNGRLPDGRMPFKIILPADLADLFEAEMKAQRRKKLPMAVWMILQYFRDKELRNQLEGLIQHRGGSGPVPHFGDEPSLRNDAAPRKESR